MATLLFKVIITLIGVSLLSLLPSKLLFIFSCGLLGWFVSSATDLFKELMAQIGTPDILEISEDK